MATIEEAINNLAANMSLLEPMDRIEYLIDIGKKAEGLPSELKTDGNKVYGCASETWLAVDDTDDKVTIVTDSDAFIVKGMLQLLERCFNGHTRNDIIAVNGQNILNKIGLGGSISNRRMNGFASAIQMVQTRLRKSLEADGQAV